ncbi:MAG: PHP domain-containing protein, partial [Acetobacteraceae bacterium]
MAFVHLRVHSAYSLSEGAITVKALAARAAERRMPAVALTDSNNLFGALEFAQACAERGVQPIMGLELALVGPAATPAAGTRGSVVLLAKDAEGWSNLIRLASAAHLDPPAGAPPGVAEERMRAHAAGLILLTGGTDGPLGRLLADGQDDAAGRWLSMMRDVFGDRLAVELHRHGVPGEREIEAASVALADRFGLPLVATNACYFLDPERFEAHDVLLCIADRRLATDQDRRRATPEHWFKGEAEMRALFADMPEACDNTVALARRCAVMATARKPLLPASPKVGRGRSEAETLRE